MTTYAYFPKQEIVKILADGQKTMRSEFHDLLTALGMRYLSFVSQDYERKGRGLTGEDGIQWAPLTSGYLKRRIKKNMKAKGAKKLTTKTGKLRPTVGNVQIGVDTGLQRASITPGYQGADKIFRVEEVTVLVGFGRSYSKYFDIKRKLLSEKMPLLWFEVLADMAKEFGENAMKGSIDEVT